MNLFPKDPNKIRLVCTLTRKVCAWLLACFQNAHYLLKVVSIMSKQL